MKTFRKILSEVAQPLSGDERNFKDKHIISKFDNTATPESTFSGSVDKDDLDGMKRYRKNKRIADYQPPEDKDVYEAVTLKRDIPGQEDTDLDNDGDTDMVDSQLRYRRHAQIKHHKIDEDVFVIPEGILATEKNAFHTAAANAHAAGKTHFAFAGKKYPVTMSKDAAKTFAGKGKMNEKVTEPYAVGMAQAMKSTGDKPPLEKKTIRLAHKIAKGIEKNEAMDPVGREDDDIDNDGDVDKSDKYLHNRRKAITNAIRTKIKEAANAEVANSYDKYKTGNTSANQGVTIAGGKGLRVYAGNTKVANASTKMYEDLDEASDVTMKQLQKKFNDGTHEAMNDPKPGSHVELRNTKTGKRTTHYVKEDVYLSEAETNYVIKHKKTKQVLNTHSDYATAKDEHEGLGADKHEYGIYKQTKKDAALRNRNTYREDAEQIDEISKSTLGSYIRKASRDIDSTSSEAGKTSDRLKRNKLQKQSNKRLYGIEKATERLTRESFDLNEAFKAGAVKLNDGASVLLKDQDAKLLNQLFDGLNADNKKKMMKVAMTDKDGFNEILGFAREAL